MAETEPANKRPRSSSPPIRLTRKVDVGVVPIDLTAETPPEEERAEVPPSPVAIPEMEASAVAAELGLISTPPAEGPEVEGAAVTVPPEGTSAPAEVEAGEGEAEAITFESIVGRGKWVEEFMSQISMPEMQRDFLSMGSATFFRQAYTSALWTANSISTLKAWCTQANRALDGTRERAEAAEEALEEAKRQAVLEIEKVRILEEKLRRAHIEVGLQQQQLFEASTRAREAEERASSSAEAARHSEARVATLQDEIQTLKSKVAGIEERAAEAEAKVAEAEMRATEAEKKTAEAEAKAAEAEIKTAEAEARAAEAEKKVTEAVATFRQSPSYEREVAKTTAYAFNLGFKDCKMKVRQVFNLEGVEDLEPDEPEDSAPSSSTENSTVPPPE